VASDLRRRRTVSVGSCPLTRPSRPPSLRPPSSHKREGEFASLMNYELRYCQVNLPLNGVGNCFRHLPQELARVIVQWTVREQHECQLSIWIGPAERSRRATVAKHLGGGAVEECILTDLPTEPPRSVEF